MSRVPGTTKEFDPFKDAVLAANVDTLIEWCLGDGEWDPRNEDGVPIGGMVVFNHDKRGVGIVTDENAWSCDEARPVRALLATGRGEALAHVIVRSASEPVSGNGKRAEILHVSVDAPLPEDELTEVLIAAAWAETGSCPVVRDRPTVDSYQAVGWEDKQAPAAEPTFMTPDQIIWRGRAA